MPAPESSPIPPVVRHLACAVDTVGLGGGDLWAVLAKVTDPRKRRVLRHHITAILGLAVCAVLAGCR